jgi:hypothetical protein
LGFCQVLAGQIDAVGGQRGFLFEFGGKLLAVHFRDEAGELARFDVQHFTEIGASLGGGVVFAEVLLDNTSQPYEIDGLDVEIGFDKNELIHFIDDTERQQHEDVSEFQEVV